MGRLVAQHAGLKAGMLLTVRVQEEQAACEKRQRRKQCCQDGFESDTLHHQLLCCT
jgi:hypothetical protein